MKDQVIAVWFSCGAASAVAAKKTLELYGANNEVRILNSPVKEEGEDNRRFLKDVEAWLGHKIEVVINPEYPNCSAVEVWERRKYMAGIAGAPCTLELKKKPRQLWERENHVDWIVLGFTSEERKRHDRFVMNERDNLLPVLIDLNISKPECAQILAEAGIKLPEAYRLGYANANCRGCVKMTSPAGWAHVRKVDPQVFREREEQSFRLGAKLVRYKGERIQLTHLPTHDFGEMPKNMQSECGLFCEESS